MDDELKSTTRTRLQQAALDAERSAPSGEALRNQPPADMSELRSRLTATPSTTTSAVPPRNVPVGQPGGGNPPPSVIQVNGAGQAGVVNNPNINPNVRGGLSPEADAFTKARAAAPAAAPAAPAAAAPPTSLYGRMTQAASESARSALPPGGGVVARAVPMAGSALRTIGGVAARTIAPAIETYNTAKVAADPHASKVDVATQAAEGVGRTASTIAGAGIGGALGAMTGPAAPVLAPVGAMAGGAAGYFGGDALIRHLRSAFGLDPQSPADRAPPLIRQAIAAPAAAPATAPSKPAPTAAPTPVQRQGNVAATPVPATINAAAATAPVQEPSYTLGKNATEIYRPGGERTVATFAGEDGQGGAQGEVPGTIYDVGRTAAYRAAQVQGAINDQTDPRQLIASEREKNAGVLARENLAQSGATERERIKANAPHVIPPSANRAAGMPGQPSQNEGYVVQNPAENPTVKPLGVNKPQLATSVRQAQAALRDKRTTPQEAAATMEAQGHGQGSFNLSADKKTWVWQPAQ